MHAQASASRRHPAWAVACVTAGALLAASAFRSTTGALMEPIEASTGWSRDVTSGAASLNLVLYGLAAPFTAALMQAWGVRRTVTASLVIVALASAAVTFVGQPWQLWLLWGVFIGLGTGSMALTFGTIVANRWFITHRGTVTGIFSAATAAGQVLFVPVIAMIAAGPGWRTASLVSGVCSLAMAVLCLLFLRDRPADVGARAVGAGSAEQDAAAEDEGPTSVSMAVTALRSWPPSSTPWVRCSAARSWRRSRWTRGPLTCGGGTWPTNNWPGRRHL